MVSHIATFPHELFPLLHHLPRTLGL